MPMQIKKYIGALFTSSKYIGFHQKWNDFDCLHF